MHPILNDMAGTYYKDQIPTSFPGRLPRYLQKVKKLQEDPHYVALGMAIGVFVSITHSIFSKLRASIALRHHGAHQHKTETGAPQK